MLTHPLLHLLIFCKPQSISIEMVTPQSNKSKPHSSVCQYTMPPKHAPTFSPAFGHRCPGFPHCLVWKPARPVVGLICIPKQQTELRCFLILGQPSAGGACAKGHGFSCTAICQPRSSHCMTRAHNVGPRHVGGPHERGAVFPSIYSCFSVPGSRWPILFLHLASREPV